METVNIYVKDKSPATLPVQGVLVRVYDSSGTNFYTQGTTDVDGFVGLTIPAGTYQLRFYKYQVSFQTPQLIEVIALESNTFDVSAEVFTFPMARDARLCRASGFFRNITGAPAANVDMHFIAKFDPILLEGSAVLTERALIRTDSKGYAEIDLIRFGKYDVMIQGYNDVFREVCIPDAASVNLPDLLFPVVARVTFDPTGDVSVGVGSTTVLTPRVIFTDGDYVEGNDNSDVLWAMADPAIAGVTLNGDTTLTITGIAAGTTSLVATRRDTTIIRIPDTDILGVPLKVVVS